MSNGEVCCILGICCPPDEARQKLIDEMLKRSVMTLGSKPDVEAHADYILETFDLAPKGLLQPLVDYVALHARKGGRP